MKLDLNQIETEIMSGLKDFQRATVNRVFDLFQSGQNRVLVADEVGLGKTLIAKGIISKKSRYHFEELQDDIFKVVYICSNSSIANQNMKKLKISKEVKIENVSDTRLSMQHLKIFEQENDEKVKESYIQLIPLTPLTSFSMTNGGGNVSERALMFAILKRMEMFKPLEKELEILFIDTAFAGWKWACGVYEPRVVECNKKTNGHYISTMTMEIEAYLQEHPLFLEIERTCKTIRENGFERISGTYPLLQNLRMMFARISVERMNPDLVIMDEFQRFKFLISQDVKSETGILADRFLKGNETNILLLSATPYKLYSTLEEINEAQNDDHYREFFQVMNFLFQQEQKQNEFKEIWSNYSSSLREINHDHFTILEVKNKAADAMYQAVCRTERISAIDTGDFIDDRSVKATVEITEKDILCYIEAENLLAEIGEHHYVPVDYVKSTPYLLSFMKQYQLKQHIEKFFKKYPDQITLANKKHLWIDKKQFQNYRELEPANARLEKLKEAAFKNHSELLLWVPPSQPYYEPQGVFKNKDRFSKVLVFSALEMVPRMIASLISYEAERKTVGKLVAKNKEKKNTSYFAPNNKRFPVSRLRFNVDKGTPNSMSLFCLLYPSHTLANLYNPIASLNEGKTLEIIETDLINKVDKMINGLKMHQKDHNRIDDRWYFLAPILFDGEDFVENWFEHRGELLQNMEDEEEEKGHKGFLLHLDRLEDYYDSISEIGLGKMPDDLSHILVKMAIASPAVCAYRANGNKGLFATQLAKAMINLFNRPEATAIIELCYGDKNGEAHWKNVLSYCCDGNFQALFDEYVHLLVEANGVKNTDNPYKHIHTNLLESLKTYSANYRVDTYKTFKNKVKGKKEKGIALRSHFAVGFYKDEGDNQKGSDRKESIRNSFNSPFRPFVLATTSIGQEGLDFHLYCRKIMHWNLPSNPIDLEQREGRINRFKCLAIRQNIALKYGKQLSFKQDVWEDLFDFAKETYSGRYSELIPFWCLPDDQEIKIERIVPLYPMSKDIGSYRRLIKILSLYRITLGQARQEELLEYLLENSDNSEELKDLFINLSPYYKEKNTVPTNKYTV